MCVLFVLNKIIILRSLTACNIIIVIIFLKVFFLIWINLSTCYTCYRQLYNRWLGAKRIDRLTNVTQTIRWVTDLWQPHCQLEHCHCVPVSHLVPATGLRKFKSFRPMSISWWKVTNKIKKVHLSILLLRW